MCAIRLPCCAWRLGHAGLRSGRCSSGRDHSGCGGCRHTSSALVQVRLRCTNGCASSDLARINCRYRAERLVIAFGEGSSARHRSKQLRFSQHNSTVAHVRAFAPQSIAVDDVLHRFVAERLRVSSGASLKAGAAWSEWQQWCSCQGIESGSQKSFGAGMRRRFKHERNSNRPRYVGVSVRLPPQDLSIM